MKPSNVTLLLGVTRAGDAPQGDLTGLIYRDGEVLRWGALDALFAEDSPHRFARLVADPRQAIAFQALARLEHTVKGSPRLLVQAGPKLAHHDMRDVLQFSEAHKALLRPQALSRPLPLAPLAVAYLEVSRLSDGMRRDMLGGERSLGQLAELLGLQATDATLGETLWELARRDWLTVHELGKPADNAIALNRPVPAPRIG
ncbi:MAG: hypothetical protein VKP62_06325 [Candidatus Sericytochromatia bacterium]|nr:hypothetical protein [Candidatus Sericytochromatia bacterium]